jgi:uncharacterized protein (TIGR02266 family)
MFGVEFPDGRVGERSGEGRVFDFLWRRGSRAVLIVSENPAEPLFDSEFLRQPDIRLLTSFPDEEAYEVARRERPSLIVEDLAPPGHAGLALCRELASHPATRSIPLILVTSDRLWSEAQRTRADVVLAKPLKRRQFFDAVRRFVPLPRRRTPRVTINLRFRYAADDHMTQAFSRDLSVRGTFLKTDRTLPLGTRVVLEFCLPGLVDEMRCSGVVRNTCSTTRFDPGGIGIEFEGLSDGDRELLSAFIEQQR